MNLYMLTLMAIILSASCAFETEQQVGGVENMKHNSNINALENTVNESSVTTTTDQPNERAVIRTMLNDCVADFKNFTYDWFPVSYSGFVNERKITLVNGASDTKTTSKENFLYEASLADVSCLDLTGDDNAEAIVTVDVSFSNKARPKRIFIFGSENEAIELLWHYDTGTEERELRGIYTKGETLVIEEYDNKYGEPTPAYCCPQRIIRTSFSWRENDFRRISVEYLPYENNYREFIGYARS